MKQLICPQCLSGNPVKNGFADSRQRYFCKKCSYRFTVNKFGKQLDSFYRMRALQLHMEGLSYRKIEQLLGIGHSTIMNWVRQSMKKLPKVVENCSREVLKVELKEVGKWMEKQENRDGHCLILTEGGKYCIIIQTKIK